MPRHINRLRTTKHMNTQLHFRIGRPFSGNDIKLFRLELQQRGIPAEHIVIVPERIMRSPEAIHGSIYHSDPHMRLRRRESLNVLNIRLENGVRLDAVTCKEILSKLHFNARLLKKPINCS